MYINRDVYIDTDTVCVSYIKFDMSTRACS